MISITVSSRKDFYWQTKPFIDEIFPISLPSDDIDIQDKVKRFTRCMFVLHVANQNRINLIFTAHGG